MSHAILKRIGTYIFFCWIGLVSFFSWISIDKPSIVRLFLNRSSNSLKIFSLLSTMVLFRIMFVFLLPCKRISGLSNQSSPSSGCVFLFSVMSIGSTTLLFSVLTSTSASPQNFIGFLLTSTKNFVVFISFFGNNYRRNYSKRGSSVNNKLYWLSLHQ